MTTPDLTGHPGLRAILDRLGDLPQRFLDAGHELHLVGGVVRDLLRGVGDDQRDLDLTTDARPDDTVKLLAPWAEDLWQQGRRFGTIGARRDDVDVEITTYRAERYSPDTRKPEVAFGDTLAEDLVRRDFTVNAMAVTLPGLVLQDPHGGLDDLRERRLDTPLAPEISFDDDPLRMLRGARFVARDGFTVAPRVAEAMASRAERLTIVSAERVRDELLKLLGAGGVVDGLRLLTTTGLAQRALPAADLGEESLAAVASIPADPWLRMALLHRHLDDPNVAEVVAALRPSNAELRLVRGVTGWWREWSGRTEPPTDAELRRFADRFGADRWRVVDASAPVLVPAVHRELSTGLTRLEAAEDLDDLSAGLSGPDVMDVLGIEPGPAVGKAVSFLRSVRLEHGPLPPEELRARLRRWWVARSGSSLP